MRNYRVVGSGEVCCNNLIFEEGTDEENIKE